MPEPSISFEACRPVTDDARQIMTWRNDPVTLSMFFHRDPKLWESFWPEYRDGYFRHPEYPAPVFALREGRRIGFLRFESMEHPLGLRGRTVGVSINIAPEARGKGLGTAVLKAALSHLAMQGFDTVCAEVREENVASRKVFAAAGFRDLGPFRKLIVDTDEQCTVIRFVAVVGQSAAERQA
jgi:N-acetylneuraminate synthase